ncbi:substrate-binding periplasmic protein [Rhodoferax sp. WC2427]|uniref:substrate-binding periplasmic protein n=1 Tax=Rhodoferax sp. WC2427 TaxID=3234144 RepID=UPI0034653F52
MGAALLVLAAMPGLAQQVQQVQQVLQIGRTDSPSPLSDIAESVVKEAFKRSGLQCEFQRVPLSRSMILANDGSLDGDVMRIADAAKTYTDVVAVPTPVVWADLAIYSMDEKVANLPRAELRHRKVGLTRTILMLPKYSQGMDVTDAKDVRTAFEMLANGRFEVAMLVYLAAEPELARQSPRKFYRGLHAWATEPLYFHLNKKHATLVPRINAALLGMQKEGLVKKIFLDKLAELGIPPLKPAE